LELQLNVDFNTFYVDQLMGELDMEKRMARLAAGDEVVVKRLCEATLNTCHDEIVRVDC